MRALNNNSVFYIPDPVPAKPEELQMYLQREFDKLERTIELLALGHVDKTHVAPTKPREGDIRLADGTNWNPGYGQGFYGYYGGAWVKLG